LRKKAELVSLLLALAFIAAAALLGLTPKPEGVYTARSASAEEVLTGADSEAASELMLGEKVNINTADAETLCLLPGIDEKISARIIAFREENGDFSCIEDIVKVSGIGEKKLEKLWNLITVGKEN